MSQDTEIREAMEAANQAMYQAGKFDQMGRVFAAQGDVETAEECARRKQELQVRAERIIGMLPVVA